MRNEAEALVTGAKKISHAPPARGRRVWRRPPDAQGASGAGTFAANGRLPNSPPLPIATASRCSASSRKSHREPGTPDHPLPDSTPRRPVARHHPPPAAKYKTVAEMLSVARRARTGTQPQHQPWLRHETVMPGKHRIRLTRFAPTGRVLVGGLLFFAREKRRGFRLQDRLGFHPPIGFSAPFNSAIPS